MVSVFGPIKNGFVAIDTALCSAETSPQYHLEVSPSLSGAPGIVVMKYIAASETTVATNMLSLTIFSAEGHLDHVMTVTRVNNCSVEILFSLILLQLVVRSTLAEGPIGG